MDCEDASTQHSSGFQFENRRNVPSTHRNVLANSITARVRASSDYAKAGRSHIIRETEKDTVRLSILEKQLFKAGIQPHRSLFKWDNSMKYQQKNNFRSINLNKRNFQRMRGHRDEVADALPVVSAGSSSILSAGSSTSRPSDDKYVNKRKSALVQIEIDDWENDTDSDSASVVQGCNKLLQSIPNIKNSDTAANQNGCHKQAEVSYTPSIIVFSKRAKEPSVPFQNFSIKPIENRAKTFIDLDKGVRDRKMGCTWTVSSQPATKPGRLSSGYIAKDLHPVSTGLDRQGTSVEKLRFKALNKPGDFNVTKVWNRVDIGKIIQPHIWAMETSRIRCQKSHAHPL